MDTERINAIVVIVEAMVGVVSLVDMILALHLLGLRVRSPQACIPAQSAKLMGMVLTSAVVDTVAAMAGVASLAVIPTTRILWAHSA